MTPSRVFAWPDTFALSAHYLENHVKVRPEPARIVPEEGAGLRIGDIGMYRQRVEVVGQIVAGYRKAQRIFGTDFDVFQHSRVRGKKVGIPRRVGGPDIITQYIVLSIGESVAVDRKSTRLNSS